MPDRTDRDLSLHGLLDELERVKQQLKRAQRALEQDVPDANAAWPIIDRQVKAVDVLQNRIRNLAKDPPNAPSKR